MMNLKIIKKEQAFNTRLGMGLLLALVGFAFCYAVYGWFIDINFFGLTLIGKPVTLGLVLGVVAGIGCTAGLLWLVLFWERSVEFLVRVDREIKKVTWPGWDQLKNSVLVIVGVIVFFGLVVTIYDMVFLWGIWEGLLGLK